MHVAGQGVGEGLIHVGCAGWSVPGAVQEHFPAAGTHLERYGSVFGAVEINTSFYRPHRAATYARWRDSVPEDFRFAVKMPKAITHTARLRHVDEALEQFIEEAGHLGRKLGCLLVQLPPSLQFESTVARQFFELLRTKTPTAVVCEPRHPTWFAPSAAALLEALDVPYVSADPSPVPLPVPVRERGVLYIRLHGSPVIYHSTYSEDYLDRLAERMTRGAAAGRQVWCIFDNTASGAAVPNALSLLARLRQLEAIPA